MLSHEKWVVRRGPLYAYFSSKESLFTAVVTSECQRQAQILDSVEAEQLPIALALRQVGNWFLDFIIGSDVVALHRIVIAEAHRFPEFGRIFFECGPVKVRSMIAAFLNRPAIRRELNIPNTEVAAEIFLSLIKGQFQTCSALGFAPPSASERIEWVNMVVDFWMAGYDRQNEHRSRENGSD